METPKILSFDEVVNNLKQNPHPKRRGYKAMFSTWYGGIVCDPQLMFVPIDDHMVHRGDAVFEAIKSIGHKIYGLDRHLERLLNSAEKIGLQVPYSIPQIREIAVATLRAAGVKDGMIRLYVSRGPGGFTTNPYECVSSQLYLVVTDFVSLTPEKYERGVKVKISSISVKEGFFSTVKSCNYLPNVLMKKESVDAGVDFTVSCETDGALAESSTENFAIISKDSELLVPGFEKTLRGVTAVRVMELAGALLAKGTLKAVKNARITLSDVCSAQEAMMLGTTLDVLPVTEFEGKPVGDGSVGPVCHELLALLRVDMNSGPMVLEYSS